MSELVTDIAARKSATDRKRTQADEETALGLTCPKIHFVAEPSESSQIAPRWKP